MDVSNDQSTEELSDQMNVPVRLDETLRLKRHRVTEPALILILISSFLGASCAPKVHFIIAQGNALGFRG